MKPQSCCAALLCSLWPLLMTAQALMDQLDREKILVFCNAKKDQKTCGCQNERGCPSSSKLYGPGRRSSDEAQEDTGVRIVSGGWAVQEDDGTEAGAVGKGASAGSFQVGACSSPSYLLRYSDARSLPVLCGMPRYAGRRHYFVAPMHFSRKRFAHLLLNTSKQLMTDGPIDIVIIRPQQEVQRVLKP